MRSFTPSVLHVVCHSLRLSPPRVEAVAQREQPLIIALVKPRLTVKPPCMK